MMLNLAFDFSADRPLTILCLGAHSDDIEIGAGGTVLTLLKRWPVQVRWIVLSATGVRAEEAHASARDFLTMAKASKVETHNIRDGFFPHEFARLKEIFEGLKEEVNPDVILTHVRHDHHQDHRTIAEITWNTFRDHLILGYEIPKYDPDLGNPNLFVPLSAETGEQKISLLMKHFVTQQTRRWFRPETFQGMLRIRGIQAAASSGLAEAHYVSKVCL